MNPFPRVSSLFCETFPGWKSSYVISVVLFRWNQNGEL